MCWCCVRLDLHSIHFLGTSTPRGVSSIEAAVPGPRVDHVWNCSCETYRGEEELEERPSFRLRRSPYQKQRRFHQPDELGGCYSRTKSMMDIRLAIARDAYDYFFNFLSFDLHQNFLNRRESDFLFQNTMNLSSIHDQYRCRITMGLVQNTMELSSVPDPATSSSTPPVGS